MAKQVLTPEEKAAQEAAKKAAQETAEKAKQEAAEKAAQEAAEKAKAAEKIKGHKDEHSKLDAKIKSAFENFPTADKLYVDGEELFFAQVKANMKVVHRADFIKKTNKQ